VGEQGSKQLFALDAMDGRGGLHAGLTTAQGSDHARFGKKKVTRKISIRGTWENNAPKVGERKRILHKDCKKWRTMVGKRGGGQGTVSI